VRWRTGTQNLPDARNGSACARFAMGHLVSSAPKTVAALNFSILGVRTGDRWATTIPARKTAAGRWKYRVDLSSERPAHCTNARLCGMQIDLANARLWPRRAKSLRLIIYIYRA
jgi:hypothetical protein